ncbi:hypothetical protein H8F21_15315 [Pseudomonas sp. P66]|uniref:Uncharacterized protein n=1 Tax=Pseudomonas arcuscaelestis TaxID=2710591 RepID=A0ABS2BZM6_9PSED|nr:hypothetical protein [Pseudomonas arcuscaelestis]MBM5458935.1 hypothetical protein [Pseudomonas arcuscaelestis]
MAKKSHRSAYNNDPKFLERLARQGITFDEGRAASPATVQGLSAQVEHPRKESQATKRMRKVQEANMDGRSDRLVYDQASNSLTAFLPGALLLSLNVMLRMHDAKSTSLKSTWLKRIEALRLEGRGTFSDWIANASFPVLVEEVYITPESNLLDHEAVAAACKPILDAFVVNGFLPDDNGRYIAQPLAYTERGADSGLLIRFLPTQKPWGLIDDTTMELARGCMTLKK